MNDLNDDSDLVNKELPDLTQVHHLCKLCCLDFNYIPKIKKLFINSWEFSFFMPLLVSSIIFSSYYVYIHFCLKFLAFNHIYITIILTFFLILFFISYFVAFLEGPGYLPFYYPFHINDEDDKYRLNGVVTSREQIEFISDNIPEQRIRYFKTARRYVIRPDHYCEWFASFIGKKNHKLFLLFNAYGFIYIGMFLVFDFWALLKVPSKRKETFAFPVLLIYALLAFIFFSFTFAMFIQSSIELSRNETTYEILKRRRYQISKPKYQSTKIEAWEEICGSRHKWLLWLIPIPAFHGIDEYLLVNQNPSTNNALIL